MSEEERETPPREPLQGVAALADRPVDGRKVAWVMGIVGLALVLACAGAAEALLAGANVQPEGSDRLRALATDGPTPARAPGRLAVVLIDGLRVDEARAMRSWASLRPDATIGTVRLRLPTLSRPFYHHLLTGVPSDVSGVRSNRFEDPARFDSLTDRVRAAGGRVLIAADGLGWMRRMHGRPGDGGSDAVDALEAPLDAILAEWRAAPAPSLLLVHFVTTDATAHRDGIHSEPHRRALATADALIARIAEDRDAAFALVSDHGHREPGGHGGDEAEVIHAPLLVRVPGVTTGAHVAAPIDPDVLAPSLALALGVARPRTALGRPLAVLAGAPPDDAWPLRAGSIAHAVRVHAAESLSSRRRWAVPLALFFAFALLGPIKRAYGFDRSTLVAFAAPFVVVALHLAWRPISLSAIDERAIHVARVVGLGAAVSALVILTARGLGRGTPTERIRRAAATVGWSALASVLAALAACGFALGPWSLSVPMFYLPLLACGAGAGALAVAAITLLVGARRESTN